MSKQFKPWYSDGLIHQIDNPYMNQDFKKTTVIVSDTGDYSIFIKENLENAKGCFIKTKNSEWYEATEIVGSPSGSILYFKEQVGKVFKRGCIYPVIIVVPFVLSLKKIEEIMREMFKNPYKVVFDDYA